MLFLQEMLPDAILLQEKVNTYPGHAVPDGDATRCHAVPAGDATRCHLTPGESEHI